jgi:hypothetical protein
MKSFIFFSTSEKLISNTEGFNFIITHFLSLDLLAGKYLREITSIKKLPI